MIINKDNRLPAWQLARQDPEKFNHSLAVAKIINKKTGGTATAFRIGPGNHMMTNAHVMKSGDPRDFRVEFTDANGRVTYADGDRLLAFSASSQLSNPRPDVSNRPNLDFALFTINPSQFTQIKRFGHLELDVEGAKAGQQMYIPQYSRDPDGQTPKTIAVSDDAQGPGHPSKIDWVDRVSDPDSKRLSHAVQYTADTDPGASGSPVISADSHKVIALHNGAIDNLLINTAANMSTIWQEIKGFFKNTAPNTPPATQQVVINRPQKNKQYQVGDQRNRNGTLQELWKNPSGGKRWIDVWQSKHYSVGALVIRDGTAYAYLGSAQKGVPQWASVFDPAQQYRPDEKVYYYGRIVDANQLIADLAIPRKVIH